VTGAAGGLVWLATLPGSLLPGWSGR